MTDSIQQMTSRSKAFPEFARAYFQYLGGLLESLDIKILEEICEDLESARRQSATVFVIGNGGSAMTSSHLANDLGFGARAHDGAPLKVLSLTDNVSVLTAIANDEGYDKIFVRQLQLYFQPTDRLLVVSASGNSPNLIAAACWVKENGGTVLGLLGFDGGKLKGLCDKAVVVQTPKGEYGPVEDIHMILDHVLYSWFLSKAKSRA